MYHSITFGDKNTWDDWHLVPTSRPVFNPPKHKSLFMDIPGGNGLEDLSEVVTAEPIYSNREGSFEFLVMNGYKEWQDLYSEIMDYLHGQRMRASLEDDPAFCYEGRFTVNQWKSDKNWSKIVIDYSVAPYKVLKYSSLEYWVWDDIDFEQNPDLVGLRAIEVNDSWVLTFKSLRRTIIPVFTVSTADGSGLQVTISDDIGHNKTVAFLDGDNRFDPSLRIYGPAITTITVTGTGTISIDFRMGRL
jgi:hypothetical protein